MISPVQTADDKCSVCSSHHQGEIVILVSKFNYRDVNQWDHCLLHLRGSVNVLTPGICTTYPFDENIFNTKYVESVNYGLSFSCQSRPEQSRPALKPTRVNCISGIQTLAADS